MLAGTFSAQERISSLVKSVCRGAQPRRRGLAS